ncbi:MAG: site-specific DNA-methyltransferase [Fibrobacter sp.]|nr:site-specific DNA-methyltransferase [Fibrobacter sp.]
MAETLDGLKVRIRELEKEVERWKSQVKSVRYGLNWMDVPEAFDKDSEDKIPILEEVADKAVDAEGPLAGRPPHVIIEGDNYHALTCLNYTHRGKIDVIYIDPPYNTGTDGFTYKDKRFLTEFPDGQKVPKEHPLRHSYWLSFMEKRLKLAKNLLSDKGVIFISIDDNEQANLKLLCDKVFSNDVETFIWRKSGIGRDGKMKNTTTFRNDHEYILVCYKYRRKLNKSYEIPQWENDYGNPDNDFRGPYKAGSISRKEEASNPNHENYYSVQSPSGKIFTRQFDVPQSEFERLNNDHRIYWGKKGDAVPAIKIFVNEKRTVTTSSLIDDKSCTTTAGSKELVGIMLNEKIGEELRPKPSELVKKIIHLGSQRSSIILDFFAGSGTTLHATLNLNKEDDGYRQCILVQQSEGDNNICENITYERNRRVMCGYTNAKSESVEGLGGSLKYYKTGFVGKHQSKSANDADKVELAEKAGCLIALAENTLETIKVPKAAKGFWQIYSDNAEKKKRYTCIYHNGDYGKVSDFVAKIDELRANDKKSKFTVYVFSWNSPDFFENEFDDLKNIEIKAIPKPILEIYKALNG